jgi:hypothetical protein
MQYGQREKNAPRKVLSGVGMRGNPRSIPPTENYIKAKSLVCRAQTQTLELQEGPLHS